MAYESLLIADQILAVDIGATNIKFAHVNEDGVLLRTPRRRPTPYPCTPERLVEFVEERITSGACRRVGVGFPGEFRDGRVVRPGNLSRPGGVATDVDPDLEARWEGYALQEVLRERSGRDVRVVNDATLAALGCVGAGGVELVLTLGTGCGLALARDGHLQKVRDVGAEVFRDARTYDQVLGERGRALDEATWLEALVAAADGFAAEFLATTVHVAGGNARRVTPTLFEGHPYQVVINGNDAPLRGAARLFA